MTRSPASTVLILGANGRLGLAAAQAFDAAGWRVLASVRRDAAEGMPSRARLIRTPIEETERFAVEAAGAQVVVHALNPLYTRWDDELLPMARAGMRIAEVLGARFMLPGNVYNFGAAMPARLMETTPQRATTPKGSLRVALESELERLCDVGRLSATVICAGDFYGGGTGSWFDMAVVKSIRAGKLVYPGPMNVPHAWAYLPDLARAFVTVASRPATECGRFERFHFAGHTMTGAELLDGIARAAAALGIAPSAGLSRGTLPWGLIRIGGLLIPSWRALAEMRYLWSVPHALDNGALDRAVGPLPATPLDVALRDALVSLGLDAVPGAAGRRKAAVPAP